MIEGQKWHEKGHVVHFGYSFNKSNDKKAEVA